MFCLIKRKCYIWLSIEQCRHAKNKIMKSTLKIDVSGSQPVIKFIQPIDIIKIQEGDDYDVRDKILNAFLHSPSKADRNYWFKLHSCFPHPPEPASVQITTISPVPTEDLFQCFRNTILGYLVPYKTLLKMGQDKIDCNRTPYNGELKAKAINDFFDWLEEEEWATYEEQQPD